MKQRKEEEITLKSELQEECWPRYLLKKLSRLLQAKNIKLIDFSQQQKKHEICLASANLKKFVSIYLYVKKKSGKVGAARKVFPDSCF